MYRNEIYMNEIYMTRMYRHIYIYDMFFQLWNVRTEMYSYSKYVIHTNMYDVWMYSKMYDTCMPHLYRNIYMYDICMTHVWHMNM